jgi:phosphonate ABC transporter permease subunit PhnE
MDKKPSLPRSIWNGILFALAMLFIAYAFQVTRINLDEFRKESRQASRVRVLRALANPTILEYDQIESGANAPIYIPCPSDRNLPETQPEAGKPFLRMPACAAPGETIQVEGINFPPGAHGKIGFVPESDPQSTLFLSKGDVNADGSGHFVFEFTLPDDRTSADVQYIRAVTRQNVGSPFFSDNALATWDKIVETVFMAFLATLLGTILAFPISFLAARNLMVNVKSTLTGIALNLIGWPAGIAAGYAVGWLLGQLTDVYVIPVFINVIGAVICAPLAWVLARRLMLMGEEAPRGWRKILRGSAILLTSLLAVYAIDAISGVGIMAGDALRPVLGPFGFLGYFLLAFFDVLHTMMPVVLGLAAGGLLSSLLGRFGQRANERLSDGAITGLNATLAGLAGALLFGLIGAGIGWLYEIANPLYSIVIPAGLGALGGIILALRSKAKSSLPIGYVIYYVTRTILNGVRSIEALVMAIVFVIFVGIGPFAGVLALGLHTVVSLAKLYSEQVESISAGPIEAIEATGANRLQTIVYAVIPQIIPPYISYTMYRWDINVRMSTIIGFVGGGGIGFLLQQNINLLDYNAASTQMLAIAVVVASMDYLSSKLREKTI